MIDRRQSTAQRRAHWAAMAELQAAVETDAALLRAARSAKAVIAETAALMGKLRDFSRADA